jgi:hypothetical protein
MYDHFYGQYFMYADGLGLGLGFGLGLDTNSISGHNNRHTWSTYHFYVLHTFGTRFWLPIVNI